MSRKGWSEAPTEWVQIVRGPRPKSAKWPLAAGHSGAARSPSGKGGATAPVQGRRGSQDGSANPTRQEGRGLPPDEVMANARARVLKLEAAIAAVGESDPTCAKLREALARAKSQAQERPVADRIKHTNIFIERARKRVCSLQEDVKKAQAVVAVAQEKLAQEELMLREGEVRLQALQQEEATRMDCQEVPPTIPCNFAQELAQLRACVAELQLERDDLRAKLQNSGDREDRERKQPRVLASPALDLVPLNRNTIDRNVAMGGQLPNGGQSSASVRMETMIENADSSLRSGSRFNPLSS